MCSSDLGEEIAQPSGWKPGHLAADQEAQLAASKAGDAKTYDCSPDAPTSTECVAMAAENSKATVKAVLAGDLFTAGETIASSISYAALEAGGYRPYIPWKGRQSPFWRKNWLAAGVTNVEMNVPGLSAETAPVVAFSVVPSGLYDVLYWDKDRNKDCTADGTAADDAPFAVITATAELYAETGGECIIDTLPVSKTLGDFQIDESDGVSILGWKPGMGEGVFVTQATLDQLASGTSTSPTAVLARHPRRMPRAPSTTRTTNAKSSA